MSRINKTEIEKNSYISKSKEKVSKELDKKIRFSFKYLELNPKFNISDCDFDYLHQLVSRLKNVSDMYLSKFKEITLESLSNHDIDWDKPKYTEDSFGIPNEEARAYDPWQFGLDNNKHGRIHGFFIDNTFFIRWLDPKHRLYKLDYIDYGNFIDEHYLDLIKTNLSANGSEWAAQHIEAIERQYKSRYEAQENDNIELIKELEERENFLVYVKETVCEDCKNEIFN